MGERGACMCVCVRLCFACSLRITAHRCNSKLTPVYVCVGAAYARGVCVFLCAYLCSHGLNITDKNKRRIKRRSKHTHTHTHTESTSPSHLAPVPYLMVTKFLSDFDIFRPSISKWPECRK